MAAVAAGGAELPEHVMHSDEQDLVSEPACALAEGLGDVALADADVDVGLILYHQTTCALFASSDGSTLLLLANKNRSMGVLLDSASLKCKRYVLRNEPERMVP